MSDTESTNEPKSGGSMVGKIVIAVVVLVVILGESILAYVLIPSADEVAAAAKAKLAADMQAEKEGTGEEADEEKLGVEVELGEFELTLHQHTTNTTLRIQFVLVGTVIKKDKAEFDNLYQNNKHRLRDKVLSEIRNSQLTDLTEPGLGLIKRRILETSNTLFGKQMLTSVIFSEFTFHEN